MINRILPGKKYYLLIFLLLISAQFFSCKKQTSEPHQSSLITLVKVAGGSFIMGDTRGDGGPDQFPTHTVTVSAFSIGRYEVTQQQYQAVTGTNPSFFKGEKRPVEHVSWFDAVAFCNLLSEKEGLKNCYHITGDSVICDFSADGYRLPTEAEWEFAARGGTLSQGFKYAGGNVPALVAWYGGNSGAETHDAGTRQANELGLNDMSGNVWEWCWDWYGLYTGEILTDPSGPESGSDRIFRGGNMLNHEAYITVSQRGFHHPSLAGTGVGFRVARKTDN